MECLNNIVGLIGEETCCLSGLDFIESNSGLYLDDTTAGHIPLKASFYTDYDRMERIIPDAVQEALKQTRQLIDKKLSRNFRTWQTLIGKPSDYSNYLQTGNYYMMCIDPKNIKGGIVRINKVDIWTINGKHTGNFTVVQNGNATTSTSSTWVVKNYDMKDGTIFIYYSGDRPRDFIHTGCCGNTPSYSGWAKVGGAVLSSVAGLEFTQSNYCHGIALDVTFDCYGFSESIMCNLDYESNFGFAFASLVQLIARKNIAYNVLTSDVITPYLITSQDEVRNIINYLTAEIDITLNYLKESYGHSDCYRCNGMFKGDIII